MCEWPRSPGLSARRQCRRWPAADDSRRHAQGLLISCIQGRWGRPRRGVGAHRAATSRRAPDGAGPLPIVPYYARRPHGPRLESAAKSASGESPRAHGLALAGRLCRSAAGIGGSASASGQGTWIPAPWMNSAKEYATATELARPHPVRDIPAGLAGWPGRPGLGSPGRSPDPGHRLLPGAAGAPLPTLGGVHRHSLHALSSGSQLGDPCRRRRVVHRLRACGFGLTARAWSTRGRSRWISLAAALIFAFLCLAARPTALPVVLILCWALAFLALSRVQRWRRTLAMGLGIAATLALAGTQTAVEVPDRHSKPSPRPGHIRLRPRHDVPRGGQGPHPTRRRPLPEPRPHHRVHERGLDRRAALWLQQRYPDPVSAEQYTTLRSARFRPSFTIPLPTSRSGYV